ncbi:metal iron transporter [Rhodotorula toruloides]|uniref:Metal iron transporter n=1 Tax=Rhodotorula toruloides TaxID=5286 RepID=A0A511KFY2_RHOTO|nr:metal iron transporter [Rhodotorula toruloides]
MQGLASTPSGTHDSFSAPDAPADSRKGERDHTDRDSPAISGHSYSAGDEIELADSELVPEPVVKSGEAGRDEVVEQVVVMKDGSERDRAGGRNRSRSPSPGPRKTRDSMSPPSGPTRTPSDLEAGSPFCPPPESFAKKAGNALRRHAAFIGPGVIASVAYLDPGNWSTDLAAGSQFGYSHLFIIFLAGMMALLFQLLSTRLGCVSDYDLATHCRFALYDRPSPYKLYYRYLLLYPLYVLAEIGIVMTDLAELLGSAIAINLVIPRIPLWACVLLTSLDVLLILLLFNQYPARTVTRSMRYFELLIGVLVIVVLASFVAMLVKVGPVWKDVFLGYVPGSGIVGNGGIYIAVGIVGATVMPHAFYIGSKMATMRRLKPEDYGEVSHPSSRGIDTDDDHDESKELKPSSASTNTAVEPEPAPQRGRLASLLPSPRRPARIRSDTASSPSRPRAYFPSIHLPQPVSLGHVGFDLGALTRARTRSRSPAQERRRTPAERRDGEGEETTEAPMDEVAKTHRLRPRPTLACVRAHLTHASMDVALSLVGFALVVNSCILILGAAVFYYGDGRAQGRDAGGVSDLFDAYELVKEYLGQAFAYLFAIALFAAGQSASLTVTLSGQIVSEGMIAWRTKPWKRRLITRCIGIIPSLAVAVSVGRQGIDVLLVGSQVALSIVLTFVMIPLIIFTSQHSIMAIPHAPSTLPAAPSAPSPAPPPPSPPLLLRARLSRLLHTLNPLRRRPDPEGTTSFANSVAVIYLCAALWLLVGIANVYAMYQVANQGA